MDKEFEEFWTAKPRRQGTNPKDQAKLKFLRMISQGEDPQSIIGAARAWSKQEEENGKSGTEYVPMAVTWLNQKRFKDYQPIKAADNARYDEIAARNGYIWNGEKYIKPMEANQC